MPRGDGSGPAGMGPMTGRAAGYCAGYGVPGYANPIPGQGRGMGYGHGHGRGGGRGGRGWRHMYYATGLPGWMRFGVPRAVAPAPEVEKEMLEEQVEALQGQVDGMRKRIEELSAQPAKKA